MRFIPAAVVVAAAALCAPARAQCPAGAQYLPMSCSLHPVRQLDVAAAAPSLLGGPCPGGCYTCGVPTANEPQTGPEDIYTFQCQADGLVTLELTGQTCDFDPYVLGSACSPSTSCLAGNTRPDGGDSELSFECNVGKRYFIVVEARGAAAGGDGGTCGYTLAVNLPLSSACKEDCGDQADDDFNGLTDCQDPACHVYSGEGFCGAADAGTDAGVPDAGADGGGGIPSYHGGAGGNVGPSEGPGYVPGVCSCTAAGAPLTAALLLGLVGISRLVRRRS